MKKLFILLLSGLSFSGLSNAQSKFTVGFNAGIYNPNSNYEHGIGVNGEAFYKLSEDFDLTSSIGYLTSRKLKRFPEWDAADHHISALFGARYYILNSYVRPFVGLEAGISYSNIDLGGSSISRSYDSGEIITIKTIRRWHSEELFFGFAIILGTAIPVGNNVNLLLNARLHAAKHNENNYALYSCGFNFPF